MSPAGFAARCQAIRVEIEEKRNQMKSIESRRAWASSRRTNDEEEPDAAAAKNLLDCELLLAQETIVACERLLSELSEHWEGEDQRVLGHVVLSPPLAQGADGSIEDWAVVQIDPATLDKANFIPNALDVALVARLEPPFGGLGLPPNVRRTAPERRRRVHVSSQRYPYLCYRHRMRRWVAESAE